MMIRQWMKMPKVKHFSSISLCSVAKGRVSHEAALGKKLGETVLTVTDGDPLRLDRFLAASRPNLPFSLIQKLIRTRKVKFLSDEDGMGERWIRNADPATRLIAGTKVSVYGKLFAEATSANGKIKLEATASESSALRDSIVYVDNSCMVINKPAGLAVQGGTKTKRHLDGMLHLLKLGDDEGELRLVHRLDRDTSGCLVLGRTRESTTALAQAFKEGKVQKTYIALVSPCPSGPQRGTIDVPLYKRRGTEGEPDRVMCVSEPNEGQPAVTKYEVLGSTGVGSSSVAVVKLTPLSGRTHQVLQCPILGDNKYSDTAASTSLLEVALGPLQRIQLCLHAYAVTVPALHLTAARSRPVHCTAPLPQHMTAILQRLGLRVPSEIF